MILPVIIRPEAELDLAATQLWYEAERPGLGAEFRASVSHAVGLIASHPNMFPLVLQGARRVLLVRFPYGLFYVPEQERVVVLACIHARRDPEFIGKTVQGRRAWQGRSADAVE